MIFSSTFKLGTAIAITWLQYYLERRLSVQHFATIWTKSRNSIHVHYRPFLDYL